MSAPHTFLLEPGTWQAAGSYWDSDERRFDAAGSVEIIHQPRLWVNAAVMRVARDTPVELVNRYEIVPPSGPATTLKWSSVNPSVGRLVGTFSIVGDDILSVYASECGKFRGAEHLHRDDAACYLATGVFLRGATRISSWHLGLTRV